MEGKEYEIEDICPEIPRKNVFSFATHTMGGMDWDTNIFDIIVRNIKELQLNNNEQLITTSEINNTIPYDRVRKRQSQKMGNQMF